MQFVHHVVYCFFELPTHGLAFGYVFRLMVGSLVSFGVVGYGRRVYRIQQIQRVFPCTEIPYRDYESEIVIVMEIVVTVCKSEVGPVRRVVAPYVAVRRYGAIYKIVAPTVFHPVVIRPVAYKRHPLVPRGAPPYSQSHIRLIAHGKVAVRFIHRIAKIRNGIVFVRKKVHIQKLVVVYVFARFVAPREIVCFDNIVLGFTGAVSAAGTVRVAFARRERERQTQSQHYGQYLFTQRFHCFSSLWLR